ncbi:hypothetical protein PMV_157 [Port-miou virus]|uniref:MORN repeat-containing protein n=1 Tax=Port-miou virus TaxID=1733873 RepID=A0A0N9PUE4_9VIRU|nr:hypothetical protein PMV_157 [Port-miou virus]
MEATKTTQLHKEGEKTFEHPRTFSIGPNKGKTYTEKITKSIKLSYHVVEGTDIRHGLYESRKETKTETKVSSLSGEMTDKTHVYRRDIRKMYIHGRKHGEFVQLNLCLNQRSKEMVVVSLLTSNYRDGFEHGIRRLFSPSGKVLREWKFENGKLIQ